MGYKQRNEHIPACELVLVSRGRLRDASSYTKSMRNVHNPSEVKLLQVIRVLALRWTCISSMMYVCNVSASVPYTRLDDWLRQLMTFNVLRLYYLPPARLNFSSTYKTKISYTTRMYHTMYQFSTRCNRKGREFGPRPQAFSRGD